MRVVIGSGLGRVRFLPRLLCIPCGFVSFRQFSAPLPCAVSSMPIPSRLVSFRLIPFRPLDCLCSHRSHRYHAPPIMSSKRGGFSKGIEFDAFNIGVAERLLSVACFAVVRVSLSVRPSAHLLIISSNTPRLPLAYRRPIQSRGRFADGIAAALSRPAPRPAHHVEKRGGGAWMSSDVMRSIP